MTSKERVAMAIAHEEPDRVPVCATYVPEIEEKLRAKYHPEGDLGVALGNDMAKIASGLENSFYYKDTPEYVCPYGITWRNVRNETGHFTEIVRHPLAGDDVDRILNYQMPDPRQTTDVLDATRQAVEQYGKDKWIIGSCQCSLFEAAWYLRGLDTFMMDLAMEEDWVDEYLDKVMQYPLVMGQQFIDLGVDIVLICYIVMGVFCAIGGSLFAARMNSGQPAANVNLEFDAITAVILGGVSFSGGVGGMVGTVLGVFLIQAFNTGLTMVDIPTFWQYVARGGLLLFALTSDFIRKRNRERSLLEASKKNA